MKNILRWAMCQVYGKEKGVIIFDALMSGPLGEVVRNTEAKLLAEALRRVGL